MKPLPRRNNDCKSQIEKLLMRFRIHGCIDGKLRYRAVESALFPQAKPECGPGENVRTLG